VPAPERGHLCRCARVCVCWGGCGVGRAHGAGVRACARAPSGSGSGHQCGGVSVVSARVLVVWEQGAARGSASLVVWSTAVHGHGTQHMLTLACWMTRRCSACVAAADPVRPPTACTAGDVIRLAGYPLEVHNVTTDDGWVWAHGCATPLPSAMGPPHTGGRRPW